jgi:FkbM family methyltransferase
VNKKVVSTGNARRVLRRVRKAAQVGVLAENYFQVWRSVLVGGKLHELRLRNGVTIRAPDNVKLWNHFNDIWLNRTYTADGFDIPAGGTVVDIGANIGLFSLMAAQRAACVLSFEPFTLCFEWLLRNVEANGLGDVIRPFNSAVGRDVGMRTLFVQSEFTSNSFYQTRGDPVSVPCTTLAVIVDEHCGGRCDFLKLDCEGAEFEILSEAKGETLKRVRTIALEVHEAIDVGTRVDLEKRLAAASFSVDTRISHGPLIMLGRNKCFS